MQMSYRRHLHSWMQTVREELTEIKQSICFFYITSSRATLSPNFLSMQWFLEMQVFQHFIIYYLADI